MHKRLINPKYKELTPFLEELPDIFESSGETIYTGRNLIKVYEVDGLRINVKRYGIPMLFNRVVYSFIRKSKGYRAYTYPSILIERGIYTPEPIAYLEERKYGIIRYSYFVSVQSSYEPILYKIGDKEVDEIKDLTKSLALFTAKMHKAEIYHKDYSPGNILCKKEEGEYKFCLVDINRMRFGPVSVKRGCANFARLWGQPSFFNYLATVYAKERGADVEHSIAVTLHYRRKFWKRFSRKREPSFDLNY